MRLGVHRNQQPLMAKALHHHYNYWSSTLTTLPSIQKPHKNPSLQISKLPQKPTKTTSLKEICNQGNLRQAFLSFHTLLTSQSKDESYSSILELCASQKALTQGQQLHAHILKSNPVGDHVFLSTKLVFMYGKCGSLYDADQVFDELPHRSIFAWNALIGAYVSYGKPYEALELYRELRISRTVLDACTFASVLKACGQLKDLDSGAEIHGIAIKCGFISYVFVVNSLVAMYAKCDSFDQARLVFDGMPEIEDVVTWNSIISAYSRNGHPYEALKLFRKMQKAGISMNSYTVVGVLQSCSELSSVKLGMEIHAALIKSFQEFDVYEANALVVMYARSNRMADAVKVFNGMEVKDSVSWNSMLSGYVQNGLYDEALKCFIEMKKMSHKPDQVSVISILSASGRLGNLLNGMEIHAYAIKNGFDSNLQVGNTLIDMYAKCCYLNYMDRIFYKMPDKDFISWSTIIAGYAQNHSYPVALELFREVQIEGIKVDSLMIGSILLACSSLKDVPYVKQIHNYILRHGLFDLVLENAIVDVYGECGKIEYAYQTFEKIKNKDVVSWTSMISCYVHNGLANEALDLFFGMIEASIEPDAVTLVSILSATACLSALNKGKEIHGYLIRNCFVMHGSIGCSLVDMYGRCGTVDNSYKVFDSIKSKDLVLWTSMIYANGMHGRGKEAIHLFQRMQQTGLIPDQITFLALLYACSHSGLFEEGIKYLEIMRNEYQLEPWPEHFACVVDLLGRSNCLNEAYRFIKSMPIKPTAAVWCTLLGACHIHSNNELGEIVAQKLLELEPENPGNYVLVSNVFAMARKWEEVEEVRMRMKERGFKKNPACSWIEIGNKVHTFIVRDISHPQTEEIYSKLARITERCERDGGYVADTKSVLHDVREDEKIKMLYGHSERLAISFGLIGTPKGTPIRITKNLRVCRDCHQFTKLVSKFFEREIIVRDTNRFHHFKGGHCSCGEFW